ncbi:nitroreductase family protein [Columbia Basin potato purple top phytoplasma]|uniref:Nitroreductase family protein n=1 Tax=Columbia Basin potato purple top phytoplasma TaxID=307134 RepID=A0ABT5L8D0_9MOLU|nr:nitroreductase family protein [Columbia Basin potato purple top phytoplasma]MDC9031919.1 nitroreductase family protein [Columbia Basin potato purple top phytoplasma]
MHIKTIRTFEKNHKISHEQWLKIFDDIRYTPSSFDLQPWRFFIIESEQNKNKLKTILQGNAIQLETSSAIVLVCGDLNKKNSSQYIYNQKYLNKEIDNETKDIIIQKIKNHYNQMNTQKLQNEIFLECGIISLNLVLTMQNLGYNSCFMGGCLFEKINDLFQIPNNYAPIILIAVGKTEKKIIKKEKKIKLKPNELISFL